MNQTEQCKYNLAHQLKNPIHQLTPQQRDRALKLGKYYCKFKKQFNSSNQLYYTLHCQLPDISSTSFQSHPLAINPTHKQ
jgi:hypothetical protein